MPWKGVLSLQTHVVQHNYYLFLSAFRISLSQWQNKPSKPWECQYYRGCCKLGSLQWALQTEGGLQSLDLGHWEQVLDHDRVWKHSWWPKFCVWRQELWRMSHGQSYHSEPSERRVDKWRGELGRLQWALQAEGGLHILVLAPRECWTVGTLVCHHDGEWRHRTWHQCGVWRPWLWNRYIPTIHVYVIDLHGCVSQCRERQLVSLWSMIYVVLLKLRKYAITDTQSAMWQNTHELNIAF